MSRWKRFTSLVLTTLVITGMGVVESSVASAQATCEKNPTTQSTFITMSDGVKLSTNYWLPGTDPAGYPTILYMTPYGKEKTAPQDSFFPRTVTCYARVAVDIRGTGASGGAFCVFCLREQEDGKEVVDWIAAQKEWSNGKVGMIGGSYAGITALFTAAQFGDQPSPLKAIAPAHVMSDPYRDAAWHNGLFSSVFVPQWSAYQMAHSSAGTSGSPEQWAERARSRQPMEARLDEWDGEFYRERALYMVDQKITTPTMLWSGWFDGFSRGTIRTFEGISSAQKILVMDPFGHHYGSQGKEPLSRYRDDAIGANNRLSKELLHQWFGYYLRDDKIIEDPPPGPNSAATDVCQLELLILAASAVCYYDLGALAWRMSPSWPPATATTKDLFLGRDPSSVAPVVGKLSSSQVSGAEAEPAMFVYEPTAGATGAFSKFGEVATTPQIPLDQRTEHAKALVYATEPLQEPLELAGPMELRFWGTTTAPDVDWIVKVSHVYEDGEAELITSGYMRASHRAWDEELSGPAEPWITNERPGPGLLGAGAPYIPAEDLSKATEYRVDIWPTALTVPEGHRLAISITSSDIPTHEPLPFPAVNSILHDERHRSRLIATTVPYGVPEVALAVTPDQITGNGPVEISATVSDVEGTSDISSIDLMLSDEHDRILGTWSLADFIADGETSLRLSQSNVQLSGPSPWTVTLTATDSNGASATATATIVRIEDDNEVEESDERADVSGGIRTPI